MYVYSLPLSLSLSLSLADRQLVQVELPRDERTKIRVSPQVTISQLLRLICEKRNLEVSDHRFDLPATEESLAGKTLEQLKITSIRVVMRGKEFIDRYRRTGFNCVII